MRILITGAHFTPAEAVIEELNKKDGVEIVYVGRKTTMEGDKTPSVESLELPKLKVKYKTLITGRLQRSLSFYTALSFFKIPIGLIQSVYFLFSQKPDVILSFGGYVSVPIVLIGWLFSIPIIIHEQGLIPGLANRIGAVFADKVALSFSDTGFAKEKAIFTGNPLREKVLYPVKKLAAGYENIFLQSHKSNLPVILITGGNQGSHAVNLCIENSLKELLKISCVIHQTGQSKYKDFERLNEIKNPGYLVTKWISDDFGKILSKVDLVICRSGANTLTEIAYFAKPTITIPIANHAEQRLNAEYFQKIGLSKLIYESKLTPHILLENIKRMLTDLPVLRHRAKSAEIVVVPDAAKRLALETMLLGI